MNNDYYIPKHKFDFEAVEKIRNADEVSIQPYLQQIFEWVEDINWPVAKELVEVLVKFDVLIIPFLKDLIQKPDGLREYSFYYLMLPLLTNKQLLLIKEDLERVAKNPTSFEKNENYDKIARKYLIKVDKWKENIMIKKECVMELLIGVCPSFKGKWEKHLKNIWDRESETILYTDLSELARHLATLVKLNQVDEFPVVFDKIEYLLQHGDPFVQEAVVAGLLEDFQNNLLYNKCQLDLISQYLKAETKDYWTGLIKFWSGETSYTHKHE